MNILVLNTGSSTLKFQVIEVRGAAASGRDDLKRARGLVDRIGGDASCTFEAFGAGPMRENARIENHGQAMERLMRWLDTQPQLGKLEAVGHRVVHGGDRFVSPVLIDDRIMGVLEEISSLAPLHNPAALSGMQAARAVLGTQIPMVAVFDTSFHQTLPAHAFTYAIPLELTQRHGIRRYGFHGLAHRYAALRYGELTSSPSEQTHLVTLHLGNGSSVSAIRGGQSVDTSMGFTPLEGLVMGTRCGDLDPAIVGYLAAKEDVGVAEIDAWLNQRSGLLGISGLSHDMRVLVERMHEDKRARLAIEVFCHRARKYLGAYLAVLGGAAAVIFSGGIGENQPLVREKICAGMEWCGLQLDSERNASVKGVEDCISTEQARLRAYVIPTDEEALIARDTTALVRKSRDKVD
jgi:acetate kinase